jgi:hypothetical protein
MSFVNNTDTRESRIPDPVMTEVATDSVLEGEPSFPDEFFLLYEVAEPDCTDLEFSRRGGTFSADLPQVNDSHFHLTEGQSGSGTVRPAIL